MRLLICATALILIVLASNVSLARTQSTTNLEPSLITKAIALNEPAVVLLYQSYSATFSYPTATYQVDTQGDFTFSGSTNILTAPANVQTFGSGFIISPDGYIMTNAHVVTTQGPKSDFLRDVVSNELQTQLQQGQFSDQFSQNFENTYFEFLQTNGVFSNEQDAVTAYLPFVTSTGNLTAQLLQATLSVAGDMIGTGTEKDVAIIKVSANHTLPTVQLGDSSSLSPGDSIAIIGYPGIAASTQNIAGIESYVPTATAGIVSALKTMPEGWTVIQTDATIQHGDSGGPAFDEDGNVVGIATFAGLNPISSSNELLSGINFLIPINVAKQFANEISVQNSRGPFDQRWQAGLDYFWADHYSAALQEFDAALNLYPGNPYVAQYIQQANDEISQGNDIPLAISAPTQSCTISSARLNDVTCTGFLAMVALIVFTAIAGSYWFVARRRPWRRASHGGPLPPLEYCRLCGTPIRRPTSFCTKCGTRLHPRSAFNR